MEKNETPESVAFLPVSADVVNDKLRIDKNLASRGIDFKHSYGEDGQLIFDLMIFIAYTYQHNLFQYGKLDPAEFAKIMGYDRKNLLKHHVNPAQLQNNKTLQKEYDRMKKIGNYSQDLSKDNSNEHMLMYTVLDNAIYRAGKERLEFQTLVKDFSKGEKESTISFMSLLDQVSKVYVGRGKASKIYYKFKVSPIFESHLARYFFVADTKTIVSLRKKNNTFLYVFLRNLKEQQFLKGENVITPQFDMLCNYAEINITEPKQRKRKLKAKLAEILALPDIKGSFEFYKAGKFDYGVKITFDPDNHLGSPDYKKNVLWVAFEDKYIHTIKDYYLLHYKGSNVKFAPWRRDNKLDLNIKIDIFIKVYQEVLRISISKSSKQVREYFKLN